ncbi:MAG TPA: protein kinase, partial [Solimonas sp.]|nr:protein kinase [Solimonas sp.]
MNDPTRTTIAQFLPTPAITGVLSEGTRLMEYEIRHVLGKPGGFGVTYLALDTNLDLEVAIKEYLPVEFALRGSDGHIATRIQDDDAAFAWGLRCFLNEARMLARFHHPNVVQVHRLFEANGSAYIVMEHVRGQSLGENLRQQPLTTQERLEALLLPLLDGLETVHNAGVLHRDLKPENILLRDDGTPVLIDFGAARGALGSRSQSLLNVLTAGYAPLEQYSQNGNQGPWTDIYALGAVLYRALTGRKPPDAVDRLGEDPVAPLHTVVGPGFDPRFLGAIDWALQVPSNQRPQSVAEWRSALAGASHVPVPVTAADVVPAALDLDLSPDADPTAPLELQEPEQSRPVAPVPAAIPVMSPLPSTPPPQRKPAWLL